MRGLIFWMCLVWVLTAHATQGPLKLVKSIGDDREAYTFFQISSATLGPDKRLYVADSAGYFIHMYDWGGRFIGRFGAYGQGPTDIQGIQNLQVHQSVLYYVDGGNMRIGRLGHDLAPHEPISVRPLLLHSQFQVLAENRFLVTLSDLNATQDRGLVGVLNGQGKVVSCFFKKDQFGSSFTPTGGKLDWALRQITGEVLAVALMDGNQALVTFTYPDNPVDVYLYDIQKGQEMMMVELPQPKAYGFARHLTTYPFGFSPDEDRYLVIRSLLSSRQGYWIQLLHMWVNGKKKTEGIDKAILIHLDTKGKVIFQIETDKMLKLFHVSDDGYVLGTELDADEPKLLVFSLK